MNNKKPWVSAVENLKIDDFTEKEIDARITNEKRRVERIKNKIIDLRFDLSSTRNCIKMWTAMKKKLIGLKKEACRK